MTPDQNRLRVARERAGPTIFNEEDVFCGRGHLQEGENVGRRSNGKRWCRVCARERGKKRRGTDG